ncbi:MAG: hypothetical protein IJB30_06965 [Clostridia bacterium]|nr:hypothetical protein [Clostridia bacterium]
MMGNTPEIPDWFRELNEAGKRTALKRLRTEDNGVLFAVAMDEKENHAIRRMAALGLRDQELLYRLTRETDDQAIMKAVMHRLRDSTLLDHEEQNLRTLSHPAPFTLLEQAAMAGDTDYIRYIAWKYDGAVRKQALELLPPFLREKPGNTEWEDIMGRLRQRETGQLQL